MGIHEQMISDKIRTDTYRKAIFQNKEEHFKDKVVLDVGAGTGILSFFCVQAGAKRVYSVEASDTALIAKQLIRDNGFEEKITLFHSRVEDIELPEKVDVIISEWMGYSLLYENMLPSVLYARDKWLKESGQMYPSNSKIYLCPFTDSEIIDQKIELWQNNSYSLDLSSLIHKSIENEFSLPIIDIIPPQLLLSSTPLITNQFNSKLVQNNPLEIFNNKNLEYIFKSNQYATLNGFVVWFDVTFPKANENDKEIVLSTSPFSDETHWKQSLYYFDTSIPIEPNQIIKTNFKMDQLSQDNPRFLKVEFSATIENKNDNSEFFKKYLKVVKEETSYIKHLKYPPNIIDNNTINISKEFDFV
ncbi:hypothetical protein DICPUDRAFT_49131 [Dictyostelium purpureum]|uniref:Methyltransferase domain-containing protein n=1 Tax=Dictyostelium purpureum TaxID=5786 RepID=F0ZSD4_DICPU|nr:uncharacterized protein DICPUDRAFT_49131 [Dictyostelium purpureum]EGC33129.1 hypothetical protein DICPUDRAFT_49131 [Dictyostelium purpureum]|eukprot:XP_003290324.1 hypothetical protein DICPUDRAFT_49131 [Dictyostelium purpureum]